jgi:plasmid stabilization system protein ParE
MRLIIQPAARSDILKQIAYYAEMGRNDIAERFLENTQQSFQRILFTPRSGTPKQTGNALLDGLRSQAIVGFETTRLYYLIRDDAIVIIRVLHGRRDVAGILGDHDDGAED